MVRTILATLLFVPLLHAETGAPTGEAAAGKKAWDARRCLDCHGEKGEGGFGPDLAARVFTYEQFRFQVRKPFGFMPAFTEEQISDQDLADVRAYLVSLPAVEKIAKWRVAPPPNIPRGQFLIISYGCAQCHGQELSNPREALGGVAADVNFEYFKKFVYNHTDLYPTGRMGTFNRERLPEPILHEIFTFATQGLGLIPTVSAAMADTISDGPNTTYKLYVKNRGVEGKGLAAEDVTIAAALKPGYTLVNASGDGYQGVQNRPDFKTETAVWKIPSVRAGELQIYTVTVAGKTGKAQDVFAPKETLVRWNKPVMRPGIANLDALSQENRYGPGRVSHVNIYLNRPVSAAGDWDGGAQPPGVCSPTAKKRGVPGC